jgi:hypothetical protein
MGKPGGTFRNILIWTFERGTLQYDIICAVILIFIFLVPRCCFTARRPDASSAGSTQSNLKVPTKTQTAKTSKPVKNVD